MKIVFFGTPNYVLPILTKLHKTFVTGPGKSPIVAVVTASPKPVGRKQVLSYSPIDKWAHDHKIPCFYTANDLLDSNLNFDIGILASYGEIIKKEVLNMFPHGILVIHPSLLPKYRGASPVPEAIKNGDEKTGVSIIKMDEKMDHGPLVTQFKEDILPSDTNTVLRDRLFERSADVIVETIEPYIHGKIKLKAQNESEATFTKMLTKQDGFIELPVLNQALQGINPHNIDNFIRAVSPWPGAWTQIQFTMNNLQLSKRLKLLKSHIENEKLVLDEVQLEGKNPVLWKQFKEAYPNFQI